MDTIVVTRHAGLVEYLRSEGLAPADCEVVEHATAESVRGRHVIGVLPLWLAAEAASVTEIPMSIPRDQRGVELSAEQTAEYAGDPRTYRVEMVPTGAGEDSLGERLAGAVQQVAIGQGFGGDSLQVIVDVVDELERRITAAVHTTMRA